MSVPPHKDKYIHFYDSLHHSSDWCYMIDKIIPNNERITKNIYNPKLINEVKILTYIKKYIAHLLLKRFNPNYPFGMMVISSRDIYINNKSDFIENYKKYLKYKLLFYLKCIELYVKYAIKKNSKDIEFYTKFKNFYFKKYDSMKFNLIECYFATGILL